MNKTDWKKNMKEAGCQHMDYIAEVKEEIVRPKKAEGWACKAVVVYLEKKYKGGLRLRQRVTVEHDLLIRKDMPELYLCRELTKTIEAMDQEGREVEPLDLNQDWMKALKDAGCSHMDYIKKAGLETIHDPKGDDYQAIVVYLEKEYSPGRTLRVKHQVDVELIKVFSDPMEGLCSDLKALVEAMDAEAARDAEVRSKA